MKIWSYDWPTEPGWYWFYGWCFRSRGYPAKMHLVRVRKIANGVAHVTDGHFLWRGEGAYGMWTEAVLPDPPEDGWLQENDGR
jgi:hypothetical protein